MIKLLLNMAAVITMSGILGGCSGGSPDEPPKTQAVAKVYLFGKMSSSSRVATIQSEITVPDGIMVNYSSPPGVTAGKFPLRSGSIVPSGPVTFSQNDIISAEYNLSDRKLAFKFLNTPDLNNKGITKNIRSGTEGDGVEVATLYFRLAKPDVLPIIPAPWQDVAALIGVDSGSQGIDYSKELNLNFAVSFLP
jgi:hypothetical protein